MTQPPDSPLADSSNPPMGQAVVCLVGDEEQMWEIRSSLEQLDYQVDLVERGGLVERVNTSPPHVIVADCQIEGVESEVRQLMEGSQLVFYAILLGVPDSVVAEEREELTQDIGIATFPRPFAVDQVVETVRGIMGLREKLAQPVEPLPDAEAPSVTSDAMDNTPVGYTTGIQTSNPPTSSSNPPDASPWPSVSPPPLGAEMWTKAPFAGPTSVSPDLEQMLMEAEQRVLSASTSDVPSPEEEVDAILPPEVLAALDEPLGVDANDDEVSEGASRTPVGSEAVSEGTSGGSQPIAPYSPQPAPPTSAEPITSSEISQAVGTALGGRADEGTPVTDDPDGEYGAPMTTRGFARDWAPRLSLPFGSVSPPVSAAGPVERIQINQIPAPTPHMVAPSAAVPPLLSPDFDGIRVLGASIASRVTGSLCFEANGVLRRAILRDGDFVTCASSSPEESLPHFLATRGELGRDVALQLVGRIPPFGRHAAAALIANGHLGQDQLWAVLRAHAEWLLAQMAWMQSGVCALEAEAPGRLKAEPAVFGGATGAEVLVEAARRILPPEVAAARLGGPHTRLGTGARHVLLAETALSPAEREVVDDASGATLDQAVQAAGQAEFASVLVALVALGILETLQGAGEVAPGGPASETPDLMDAEAVRKRVKARLDVALEGDYFEVLGVPRTATSYEIRRAYVETRRSLEPSRLLTAATADLVDDVRVVLEVLDEAFEVLRDATRRQRYQRALDALPPRLL